MELATEGWAEGSRAASQDSVTGRVDETWLDAAVVHTTPNTLTVREVKVMHMPPKPLKVRAMKIRTESSTNTDVIREFYNDQNTVEQTHTHIHTQPESRVV